MIRSAVVLTIESNAEKRDELLRELGLQPDLLMGELSPPYLPLAWVGGDLTSHEERFEWLASRRGVLSVDLVEVDFDESLSTRGANCAAP